MWIKWFSKKKWIIFLITLSSSYDWFFLVQYLFIGINTGSLDTVWHTFHSSKIQYRYTCAYLLKDPNSCNKLYFNYSLITKINLSIKKINWIQPIIKLVLLNPNIKRRSSILSFNKVPLIVIFLMKYFHVHFFHQFIFILIIETFWKE